MAIYSFVTPHSSIDETLVPLTVPDAGKMTIMLLPSREGQTVNKNRVPCGQCYEDDNWVGWVRQVGMDGSGKVFSKQVILEL